jgi:GNAT superfamily N-acetyltransferase
MTQHSREVRPLDSSTWAAFEELCSNSDGFPSGCFCMGFHEEGPKPHAAQVNRNGKYQRVLNRTTHAALVFDGELCVGWCQFGPPAEVVRIKNRREYDKTRSGDLPDWRIGCNYVRAGHRRQGVASDALAGALELIAAMGGGRVEGYPEPADAVPAGFLFHGVLSTFEEHGFTRDRMIGKHRWVVSKTVARGESGPAGNLSASGLS